MTEKTCARCVCTNCTDNCKECYLTEWTKCPLTECLYVIKIEG